MNAWDKCYRDLRAASARKRDNFLLFRGHAKPRWRLMPTLGRRKWKYKTAEQNSFTQFVTRAGDLLPRDATSWDIAFAMQHHGIPTRLLDWTDTLGVALYFALRDGSGSGNCAIWVLNPFELNGRAIGRRGLPHPTDIGDYGRFFIDRTASPPWSVVAINPLRHDPRVFRQRSGFTLHHDLSRPLDKLFPTAVKKFEIPAAAHDGAWKFLEDSGISEFSLFPDLDALAREIGAVFFT